MNLRTELQLRENLGWVIDTRTWTTEYANLWMELNLKVFRTMRISRIARAQDHSYGLKAHFYPHPLILTDLPTKLGVLNALTTDIGNGINTWMNHSAWRWAPYAITPQVTFDSSNKKFICFRIAFDTTGCP